MHRRSSTIRVVGGDPPWPGPRVAGFLLVAVLAAGGSGLVASGLTAVGPLRPPQPGPDAAPAGYEVAAAAGAPAAGLPPARPLRLRIPGIGVDTELLTLGVDRDGEVEVPPLSRADRAGWYEGGPTPGEVGNAVLIGHVDSRAGGPAVFFDLGRLRPGDRVEVAREDGSEVRFRVDAVASYPKDDFPADLVYGPAEQASLRLVTCGGAFDGRAGGYQDNVVAFATLVD